MYIERLLKSPCMDNWELELGAGAGSLSWEHTYAKESAAVRPLQHITRAPSNDKLYYKHNLIIIKLKSCRVNM